MYIMSLTTMGRNLIKHASEVWRNTFTDLPIYVKIAKKLEKSHDTAESNQKA